MIYIASILLLTHPAYRNKDKRDEFILIMLFVGQAAFQPFFNLGSTPYEATRNYILIICIGLCYSVYTLCTNKNKYWVYLSIFTLMATGISFIELLLFHSDLSYTRFEYVKVAFTQVIISITAIQLYLIIRATDGYAGDIRLFLQHLTADFYKLTRIFSNKVLYKQANKEAREEQR